MASQLPDMTPQQGVQFPEHYRRLQAIEQSVVEAVRTSAQVMDLLAGAGGIDRQQLSSLSSRFLELVKSAQDMVHQAVQTATAERCFEGTVYHNMVQSVVAGEKLEALLLQLESLQQLLQQGRQSSPTDDTRLTPPPPSLPRGDTQPAPGGAGAPNGSTAAAPSSSDRAQDAASLDAQLPNQPPASQQPTAPQQQQQQQQQQDVQMEDAPS